MKNHLTFKGEKSDRFWSIELDGKSFTVIYGKAGTDGRIYSMDFDAEAKCIKEAQKLINEKLKQGFENTKLIPHTALIRSRHKKSSLFNKFKISVSKLKHEKAFNILKTTKAISSEV